MKKSTFILLFISFLTSSAFTQFVKNEGQVADEQGGTHPEVLFTLESEQSRLFFEKDKIVFALHEIQFTENEESKRLMNEGNIEAAKEASLAVKTQRIDFEFIGANPNPEVIFENPRSEVQNFYLAHCTKGVKNVNVYDQVIYKNLYSGIDLVFKSAGGQVKYDIIIRPGGDIEDVKFRYNGSEKLEIEKDKLIASTDIFPLIENMPFSYWKETEKSVDISYKLYEDNIFGFQSNERLSQSETLVIDPILSWATLFQPTISGGSSGIRGNVTTDDNGNFFHQINTYIADMPLSNPGGTAYYDPNYSGSGLDIYFAKFDVDRNLVWSTFLGGSGSQNNYYDHGISTHGNLLYICGETGSTDFPTLNQGSGAFYETTPGNGFLSKFNITTGEMIHSTYLLSGSKFSVDVDNNGNVAVSSSAYTSATPSVLARIGAYNEATHAGGSDLFVHMFDANMVQTWGTYLGGTAYEDAMGVKFDNLNNLYLFNRTSSTDAPMVNPGAGAFYDNVYADNQDYWFVKFDVNGTMVWSTLFGGDGLEGLSYSQVEVNDNNEVIFTSSTRSTVMPLLDPGNGAYYQTTPVGLNDGMGGSQGSGFLMRFDENGVLLHGTYMGEDNETNYIQGQTKGKDGEHYLLFQAKNFPTTTIAGDYNVTNADPTKYGYMAIEMTPDFAINWASYVHSDSCYMERMTTDIDNGRLYITGTTQATDFPYTDPGGGAYYDDQWNSGANRAWAIMEFEFCSSPDQPTAISGATELCEGDSETYSVTNDPNADSYTWTIPNGWTGTSTTNSITVTADNSSGDLIVMANNSCGDSDQQTLSVNVNLETSASITETACKTYTSPLGNEFTTSQTIVEVLTNAAGCDSTLTIDLTVENPNVSTSIQDETITASATGVTYQWLNCEGNTEINGEVNQSYTATQNGSYAVVITTPDNCKDTSDCVAITTLKLGDEETKSLIVYPNPSKGIYTISGYQANSALYLFDANGKLITSQEKLTNAQTIIDVSKETPGIYFLEIHSDSEIVHKKLTKL
ncbi:MAG: T9SS type A sorting domain-containing protein [Brumimicrobium sp.]